MSGQAQGAQIIGGFHSGVVYCFGLEERLPAAAQEMIGVLNDLGEGF